MKYEWLITHYHANEWGVKIFYYNLHGDIGNPVLWEGSGFFDHYKVLWYFLWDIAFWRQARSEFLPGGNYPALDHTGPRRKTKIQIPYSGGKPQSWDGNPMGQTLSRRSGIWSMIVFPHSWPVKKPWRDTVVAVSCKCLSSGGIDGPSKTFAFGWTLFGSCPLVGKEIFHIIRRINKEQGTTLILRNRMQIWHYRSPLRLRNGKW